MPTVWKKFKTGAKQHFRVKNIPPDAQVALIGYQIQEPRILHWYESQIDLHNAKDFDTFMNDLSDRFLPRNWRDDARRNIKSTLQNDRPFQEWVELLQNKNALLHGSAQFLSDIVLRDTIETNMNKDLHRDYDNKNIMAIENFREWLDAIKDLDEERMSFNDKLNARVETAIKADRARYAEERSKRLASRIAPATNGKTVTTTSTTSTSGSSNRIPPLTEIEKELLRKYRGCFRCRQFNVRHLAKDCQTGAPDPATYRTLTEDQVPGAAKAAHAAAQRVAQAAQAAVVEQQDMNTQTIAHISSVLENNDGSSSDSEYVPPFSAPHLTWNCTMTGRRGADDLTVRTLIDHGSTLVLIDETLAKSLNLKRHKLREKISVKMAMDKGIYSLEEWVKITPSSVDHSWTSRPLRAIIAPKLAFPLILGGPFLSINKIVIDHDSRTCIPKDTTIDILQTSSQIPVPFTVTKQIPLSPKRRALNIIAPQQAAKKNLLVELLSQTLHIRKFLDDFCSHQAKREHIIAALKKNIETLASSSRRDELEKQVKSDFRDRFPTQLPPVDTTPTSIYHRFKLKDANKVITTRTYSCPRKYRDAWKLLLEEHITAGRLRESSSPFASPASSYQRKILLYHLVG